MIYTPVSQYSAFGMSHEPRNQKKERNRGTERNRETGTEGRRAFFQQNRAQPEGRGEWGRVHECEYEHECERERECEYVRERERE